MSISVSSSPAIRRLPSAADVTRSGLRRIRSITWSKRPPTASTSRRSRRGQDRADGWRGSPRGARARFASWPLPTRFRRIASHGCHFRSDGEVRLRFPGRSLLKPDGCGSRSRRRVPPRCGRLRISAKLVALDEGVRALFSDTRSQAQAQRAVRRPLGRCWSRSHDRSSANRGVYLEPNSPEDRPPTVDARNAGVSPRPPRRGEGTEPAVQRSSATTSVFDRCRAPRQGDRTKPTKITESTRAGARTDSASVTRSTRGAACAAPLDLTSQAPGRGPAICLGRLGERLGLRLEGRAAASSSLRISTSEASTPAAAIPAPTQNAAWKPDVSACGTASPARPRRSSARSRPTRARRSRARRRSAATC